MRCSVSALARTVHRWSGITLCGKDGLRQPAWLAIYGRTACREITMAQTSSWDDLLNRSAAEFARDSETVRRHFWAKARRLAAQLPFAEDLLTAYYCAFDRATPLSVKAALVAALAYFVLPYDLVPDMLPLIGFADDAAVLAAAIRMVAVHIRPEHRDAARAALARGNDTGGHGLSTTLPITARSDSARNAAAACSSG
jgi:uncharacterized membrane protein YkvA (DUF1232 family)